MHKTNSQDNFSDLVELSIKNAEQIKIYSKNIQEQLEGLAEVKARQDIILSKLNAAYLKEQEKEQPKEHYRPLTHNEKEELDFNPLGYLEDKGLLSLSDYESDLNFIQEVVDNYIRLGLHEFKVCIHNVIARVNSHKQAPIGNMRAYIKSSLKKHVIRG